MRPISTQLPAVVPTLAIVLASVLANLRSSAAKPKPSSTSDSSPPGRSTSELAASTRDAVVVISQRGRDGTSEGVGTGFVVRPDGLIATSLHVIGEARPIAIRLADGSRHEVTEIFAWDRKLDLAIVRIGATNLHALRLGDSDTLQQGTQVVAIGNPMGLDHSVVDGVVSARRDFDGVEMIQLAMPIEPGNSGGPLLDRQGRVHGLLNMKSALTRNLGFATPVNLLKPLLDRPNTVPLERWLALGALDASQWQSLFGARWRQKGGRILVEGAGTGFGGRALLLSREAPSAPLELAVTVKLDDEAGAAGLAFAADGGDRHYGFYPSGGQLRLTRFEGADVFSWTILKQAPSPHYRRGDWNRLRVRIETGHLRCFVNNEEVFDVEADDAANGRVGLAKFRDTVATFRDFRIGSDPSPALTPLPGAVSDNGSLHELPPGWKTNAAATHLALVARAEGLEREATHLRQMALRVHRDSVRGELVKALDGPEDAVDLMKAALLIAKYDNPGLDVEVYRRQVDEMGRELGGRLGTGVDEAGRLQALLKFLFTENGFHGSRSDYYNRANSYLSDVLDDREGLPITLSVLFLELARRVGLEHVSGVPLPGHFLVKHAPPDGREQLIDVFDGGKFLTHTEADEIGSELAGMPVRSEFLRPATKREIIVRMLTNLQAFTEAHESPAESLRYLDLIVALTPDERIAAAHRLDRARLRLRAGDASGAREDFEWILEKQPAGVDLERVAEAVRALGRAQ
jgi:S1-C subfamily serine protease/regulator of sirC expression with transglutaminase-like and TPR domain